MRIICPNCRSEYEFDGSRVSSRGTKVKCSSCEHVFTVYRVDENGAIEDEPVLEKMAKRRIGKLGGERLLLRQEGRSYPIQNLSLLQRWIVEKRVLATDEISIDGETWELVSRLGELRPFFGVLRQLRETRRELSVTRERLQETLELRSIEPSEVPGVRTTDDVVANWGEEEPVRLPAATSAPHPESLDDEDDLPPSHTEESVDRRLAEDVESPPPEGGDVAPADVAEPVSAEFVACRTDTLVAPVGLGEDRDQPEPPLEEPPVGQEEPDGPYTAGEPTLTSADTDSDRVESGLFVGLGDGESSETGPDAAGESIPIPHAARETVSRMAAEEADEPQYDPAAQSVVTPMVPSLDGESTLESPPPPLDSPAIDFDAAMGPLSDDEADEEPPVQEEAGEADGPQGLEEPERLSGEESRPLDEPSDEPAAAETSVDDVAADRPEPPPAIDFDAAMGPLSEDDGDEDGDEREEGLGKDFDTFESSYEESFPVDEGAEVWEGDDFSHQFDSAGDDEDRTSMLPYIIGAVLALVVVVAGAWFVVQGMKEKTRTLEDFDATAETAGATEVGGEEAVTPADMAIEGEGAATEEAATEDALAEVGEEPATEEEPAIDMSDLEFPPTEEPPVELSETQEPVEEIDEPPTEAPDHPEPPIEEDIWDNEPDWGEEPATVEAALPADAAAHAAGLAASGQHGEAIQEYLRAFLTDPNNPRTRKEAGWSYIEIGNNSEAAKQFRKAVLLSSMDPESHYGLGLAYEGMGRNDDAINEYETYLGLAPNGREAMEVQILLKRLVEMRDGT